MITKAQAFITSDGKSCTTLELAQKAELFSLLDLDDDVEASVQLVDAIYDNRERIIEILKSTGRAQRKARKVGATRKKKAEAKEVADV